MALTQPRKEAHRKVRKGKNTGTASRCNYVAFGEWGLQSLDNERVNGRQI
jgi:large subunit ribosomal protein L16